MLVERQRQAGHSCEQCHGLVCRGCGEGCLHFTPTALRCMGPCNMLIRRGSVYHHSEGDTTVSGDTSIQLCPKCYKRGLTVSAPGAGGSGGGAAGGADDDDGDESDEDVSHTAMAEIDKSTVASRNRVQVTQVSDPS